MPDPSPIDPAGLPALLRNLDELLRNPSALTNDPIYGKPWVDARNQAVQWLDAFRREKAQEVAPRNVPPSDKTRRRLIEAEFEAAQKSLEGFFEARQGILARRNEIRALVAEQESQDARAARLREEIARLERAMESPTEDAEFGAAISLVENVFGAVLQGVGKDLSTLTRTDKRLADALTRDLDEIALKYRGPIRARLAAEIQVRLEEAQINLHTTGAALRQPAALGQTYALSASFKDGQRFVFAWGDELTHDEMNLLMRLLDPVLKRAGFGDPDVRCHWVETLDRETRLLLRYEFDEYSNEYRRRGIPRNLDSEHDFKLLGWIRLRGEYKKLRDQIVAERISDDSPTPQPEGPQAVTPKLIEDAKPRLTVDVEERRAYWGEHELQINAHADFEAAVRLAKAGESLVSYVELAKAISPGTINRSVEGMSKVPQGVKDAISHINRALKSVGAGAHFKAVRSRGYRLKPRLPDE